MTPDGISAADWDKITELAADIANATSSDDELLISEYTRQILLLLEQMEEKYGALPSILATRADYIDDQFESLRLLTRAFDIAATRKDSKNCTFVASSISRIYIEDLLDIKIGKEWLGKLKACLEKYSDETESAELDRLSKILVKLENK